MQYISPFAGRPAGERYRAAKAVAEVLAHTTPGVDRAITSDLPPAERAQRLVRNLRDGLYIIPVEGLFPEGVRDRKDQTTLITPDAKQLSGVPNVVYDRLARLVRPEAALPQTGAWSVGVPDGARYLVRPIDIVNANLAARSARRTLRHGTVRGRDGPLEAWVHGPLTAILYGKAEAGALVSARLEGFPSSRDYGIDPDEEIEIDLNRQPLYGLLELVAGHAAARECGGYLRIDSAAPDWDLFRRTLPRYWGQERIVDRPEFSRRHLLTSSSLKTADVAGILLLDAGLRYDRGVAVNHPFPWLPSATLQTLADFAAKGVLETGDKVVKPTRSQFDLIANLYLGANAAELSRAREDHSRARIPAALELDLDALAQAKERKKKK